MVALLDSPDLPLRKWLCEPVEASSAEALLVSLHLWGRLPQQLIAQLPLLPAGAPAPPRAYITLPRAEKLEAAAAAAPAAAAFFTAQHVQLLLPLLQTTSLTVPRLHSLWPALLALLVPGFILQHEDRLRNDSAADAAADAPVAAALLADAAQLQALWDGAVEGGLLLGTSHDRKYLALQLFSMLLPHLHPRLLPVLFSRQLLGLLASNVAAPGNYLHNAAARCASRVVGYVTRGSGGAEARVAILVALQQSGGPLLQVGGGVRGGRGEACDLVAPLIMVKRSLQIIWMVVVEVCAFCVCDVFLYFS